MTKNPIINALSATLYIAIVASSMYYAPKSVESIDSVIVPIAMLSLFVLSTAVMAFLFGYQPLVLYFDGEKKMAVNFFLKTLGTFALVTATIFVVIFITISL